MLFFFFFASHQGSSDTQSIFFCLPTGYRFLQTLRPSSGDVDASNAPLRDSKLALVGEMRRMFLSEDPMRFFIFVLFLSFQLITHTDLSLHSHYSYLDLS